MINAGTVIAYLQLDSSKFTTSLNGAGDKIKSFANSASNSTSKVNGFQASLTSAGDKVSTFSNNTGNLASNFKSFDSSVSNTGENIKMFSNDTENISSKLNGLGNTLNSVGSKATTAFTIPILSAATAATKLASDFETGMAKIYTIADDKQVSRSKMADDIKDLSMEAGVDTKDIQESVYEAISSGIDTKDSVKFVEQAKKAAIGGFTDSETAVDGLTTMLNSYNLLTGDVVKNTNEIGNQMMVAQNIGKTTFGEMAHTIGNVAATAHEAGLSTKELFSSIAVLTANGLQTGEAMTGIKASLSNIIKPSEQASKAAAALGIDFSVSALKSKGYLGFLNEVRDKLKEAAPEYLKATDNVNKLKQELEAAQNGKANAGEQYAKQIDDERKAIDALQKSKKDVGNEDAVNKIKRQIQDLQDEVKKTSDKATKDKLRDQIDELNKQLDVANGKTDKKKIDEEIQAHKDKIKTLQDEEKQAKKTYSPEMISALKKELKDAEKQQELLGKASGDKLSGFATLFSSTEALNSVMGLTSPSGEKLYDQSLTQMDDGTDYLDKSYKTMEDTPEQKMKKAEMAIKASMISLGEAFLPYVGQAAEAISKMVSAFNKLPAPVKDSIGKAVAALVLLGPAMLIMGSFTKGIGSFIGIFTKVGPAVTGGVGAIEKIGVASQKSVSILSKLAGLGGGILKGFGKMGSAGMSFVKGVSGIGPSLTKTKTSFDMFEPVIAKTVSRVGKIELSVSKAKKAFDGVEPLVSKTVSSFEKIAPSADKTVKGLGKIAPEAQKSVGIISKVSEAVSGVIGKSVKTIGGLGSSIAGVFGKSNKATSEAIHTIGNYGSYTTNVFSKSSKSVSKLGVDTVSAFGKSNKAVITSVRTIGSYSLNTNTAFSKIIGVIGRFGSSTISVFGKLATPITVTGNLFSKFGGIIGFVFGKVTSTVVTGIGTITKAFGALRAGANVFSILPMLISPPVLITVGIIAGLGLIVYEVVKHWDQVKSAAQKFGEGVKNVFAGIGDFFHKSVEGWKSFFANPGDFFPIDKWIEAGGHMIDGLTKGLGEKFTSAKDSIKKLGSSIQDTFASIMGIRSPSRVFYAFGINTGEGYINALDYMKSKVNNKIAGFTEALSYINTTPKTFDVSVNTNIDKLNNIPNQKTLDIKVNNDFKTNILKDLDSIINLFDVFARNVSEKRINIKTNFDAKNNIKSSIFDDYVDIFSSPKPISPVLDVNKFTDMNNKLNFDLSDRFFNIKPIIQEPDILNIKDRFFNVKPIVGNTQISDINDNDAKNKTNSDLSDVSVQPNINNYIPNFNLTNNFGKLVNNLNKIRDNINEISVSLQNLDNMTLKFPNMKSSLSNMINVLSSMDNVKIKPNIDADMLGLKPITNNSNMSDNRTLIYSPNIEVNVTVSDVGDKGESELTTTLKDMTHNSIKNGVVEEFLKDAYRL